MKMQWVRVLVLSVVAAVILSGCPAERRGGDAGPVAVRFAFTVDESVCDATPGKRRPQIALWLEDMAGKEIRTVCVTSKTAKGNWGGQTTRPTSLPYWVGRWNKETGTQGDPSPAQPAVDAVTCATPQAAFEKTVLLPRGTRWQYYIEVNQSFDNNDGFPQVAADGRKDAHSNGQPSIVYTGRITALPGRTSMPELSGRTDQFQPVRTLDRNLSGITTAARLLKDITVSCPPQ